jgi:hypothetical protein
MLFGLGMLLDIVRIFPLTFNSCFTAASQMEHLQMYGGFSSDDRFDGRQYKAQGNSLLLSLSWEAFNAGTMPSTSSGAGSSESWPDLDTLRTLAALPTNPNL